MGRILRVLGVAPVVIGVLGCSTTRSHQPPEVVVKNEERAKVLAGQWHDPSWKSVVLSIEQVGPTTFRLLPRNLVGDSEASVGELIVAGTDSYLDLKTESTLNDANAPHQLVQVVEGNMYELGVGFGNSAKQKAFHHSPYKSYKSLKLVPFSSTYLAHHPEALAHEVRAGAGDSPPQYLVTAPSEQITAFLLAHGKDKDVWETEDSSLRMVRK